MTLLTGKTYQKSNIISWKNYKLPCRDLPRRVTARRKQN